MYTCPNSPHTVLLKVGEWSESGGLALETSGRNLYPDSKGDIVLRAVVVIVSSYCVSLYLKPSVGRCWQYVNACPFGKKRKGRRLSNSRLYFEETIAVNMVTNLAQNTHSLSLSLSLSCHGSP